MNCIETADSAVEDEDTIVVYSPPDVEESGGWSSRSHLSRPKAEMERKACGKTESADLENDDEDEDTIVVASGAEDTIVVASPVVLLKAKNRKRKIS